FVTHVDETRLDDVAAWSYRAPVVDQARLGFAIAYSINGEAPAVDGMNDALNKQIDMVVQALSQAKKPLIISGSHAGSEDVIKAAANIAFALKAKGNDVGLSFVADDANSMGLAMMNAQPLDDALKIMRSGQADSVVVMENDLYRHFDADAIDDALAKVDNLIVIDHQQTDIMEKAHLVLPASSFAESDGTMVSQEGRAQRYFQVFEPSFYDKSIVMHESWRWLSAVDSPLILFAIAKPRRA
ncbi:molybdopterin-dependent oxidoreductase, partial [Pseudomonas aeruginosa]|uniref:molybdopterin-dependent oxidoreductase n=1 Tax=Pseudomonas aeruginosa TaxID=287 RepID=UPI001C7DB56F